MLTQQNDEDKYDIAIVGMGPGGMAAALRLAEKGKKIIIFENRSHFSRVQRVILNPQSVNFLRELEDQCYRRPGYVQKPADAKFMAELDWSSPTPNVADIQKFLKRKMEILYPDSITIKRGANVKVEDIDPKTRKFRYKEGSESRTVEFSHLIAADGARHGTADQLKKKDPSLPITYQPLSAQLRHTANGTVNVDVKTGISTRDHQRELDLETDLPKLAALGWDKPYLPKIYVWPDSSERNFYIAGEVPDHFVKLTDPKER